jgi:hypothetical protein
MKPSPASDESKRSSTMSGIRGWCAVLATAGLASTVFATEVPPLADKSPRTAKTGDLVFSLMPKSFQRRPIMDMTFNTEFTPYGRLLRKATPENPVYYVAQNAGYKQLGWTVGGEKPPPAEDMERAMSRALATNGFLPATTGHPAGLVLIYFWGSHNKPDPDIAREFPQLAAKNQLERAILVGGRQFASGVAFSMEWGETLADRMGKAEYLRDQAAEELYYVVASAYDYQALAHGERKLAWRTTMTVSSTGLAMRETLPPLVASGAIYIGREMTEPEIGSRRISREGNVQIGPATVIEDKPAPAPPASTAPTKP